MDSTLQQKHDSYRRTTSMGALAILFILGTLSLQAQTNTAASSSLGGTLDQLQQTAQATNAGLSHLRVDKWKADGDAKAATQERVDSLVRNLTSALPTLIQETRKNPTDIGVVFKLYRNLNALYDVLNSVAEATGALGPKQDADTLAAQTAAFQNEQRAVADYLEKLTVDTQKELVRYRTQPRPAVTPNKIVIDDSATTKPTPKKVRKKASATATPAQQ